MARRKRLGRKTDHPAPPATAPPATAPPATAATVSTLTFLSIALWVFTTPKAMKAIALARYELFSSDGTLPWLCGLLGFCSGTKLSTRGHRKLVEEQADLAATVRPLPNDKSAKAAYEKYRDNECVNREDNEKCSGYLRAIAPAGFRHNDKLYYAEDFEVLAASPARQIAWTLHDWTLPFAHLFFVVACACLLRKRVGQIYAAGGGPAVRFSRSLVKAVDYRPLQTGLVALGACALAGLTASSLRAYDTAVEASKVVAEVSVLLLVMACV